MQYRSAFCTLDSVITQLELGSSTDQDLAADIDTLIATKYSNAQARLKQLIYDQSQWLYHQAGRVGIPYRNTYTWRNQRWRWEDTYDFDDYVHRLFVNDDLLSVETLTWVTDVLTSAQYYTEPDGFYPAHCVTIDPDAIDDYPDDFGETISLDAIWGYHTNPGSMWLDSSDTVQDGGGINTSDTEITVTDADGNNPFGVKRFETLQYIKVDDEFMQVTAVNTSTNVLTVRRAVNGTTAASHDNGATIYTYQINDAFEEAARRLTVYLYLNPGELRTLVPLPDGTIQLGDKDLIPLPPKRQTWGML